MEKIEEVRRGIFEYCRVAVAVGGGRSSLFDGFGCTDRSEEVRKGFESSSDVLVGYVRSTGCSLTLFRKSYTPRSGGREAGSRNC